jgi:hypothetical protein
MVFVCPLYEILRVREEANFWAMRPRVAFGVLIGHMFVPRSEVDGGLPDNEVTDDVSIFIHLL